MIRKKAKHEYVWTTNLPNSSKVKQEIDNEGQAIAKKAKFLLWIGKLLKNSFSFSASKLKQFGCYQR